MATGIEKNLKVLFEEGALGNPGSYRRLCRGADAEVEGALDRAMVTNAFVEKHLRGINRHSKPPR